MTDHDPDSGTGSQVLPAPGSPAHVRQLAALRAGTPPADDITGRA